MWYNKTVLLSGNSKLIDPVKLIKLIAVIVT